MEFRIGSTNNKTRLSSIMLNTSRCSYRINLSNSDGRPNIIINEKNVDDSHLSNIDIHVEAGTMFPRIVFSARERRALSGYEFIVDYQPFTDAAAKIIRPHIDARAKEHVVYNMVSEFLSIGEFSDEEIYRLEQRTPMRSFKKLLSDIRGPNKKGTRSALLQIFQLNQLSSITSASFDRLKSMLSGTRYIGPARARSERYYRYQELAVSEIDPDGKNFPMFLNSLSNRQRESFSNWVRDRFGYGISVSQSIGHISIRLVHGSSTSNIVDTGFGVSQVLPVLGQIWWASTGQGVQGVRAARNRRDETIILAIEQPELHLHPAHQAMLADAIVGERGRGKSEQRPTTLQFLIETHSEALVNRLGELIHQRRVDPDDIQILIFENDMEEESSTSVRVATFDKDGILQNWPYGFFQPIPEAGIA